MPQVPYSAVPEVSPQYGATPGVRPGVAQEAFGVAEGVAAQRFGGEVMQSGAQIMTRALAMQELNEQAAADNALTPVYDQIGERLKLFRSKSGLEASNDYEPFVKDIGGIIEKGKEGLTSDYARQVYDRNTRHVRQVTVDGAGAHAGVEFKNYQIGTEQSRVDNAVRLIGMHPEDETTYRNALSAIENSQLHVFKGWGEDQTKDYVQTQKSIAAAERAKALNQTDFRSAQKFLDSAIKAGDIDGITAGKIATDIRNQRNNVVSRVEADKLIQGEGGYFGSVIPTNARLKDAIGFIESSNNYKSFPPEFIHQGGRLKGQADRPLGRYGILRSNLPEWLAGVGENPKMTEREFVNNSAVQDKVFDKYFMGGHKNANDAADAWLGLGKKDTLGTTHEKYRRMLNERLAKTASRGEVDDVTKRHAESLGLGTDEEFNMHFRNHTNSLLAEDRRIAEEEYQTNWNAVQHALIGVPGEKLITSVDELSRDPVVYEAYRALPQNKKDEVNKVIARNAEEVYAKTPENATQYNRLMGAMLNDDLPAELKEKIIDTNFAGLKMPADMKQRLQKQKLKFMKGQGSDPRVSWAMGVLKDRLGNAGLSPKEDREGYEQFQGMLHEILSQEAAVSGTMPKDEKRIQELGNRLLREVVTGRSFFGYGPETKEKVFQMQVPSDRRDAIERLFTAKFGRAPTDKDIQQVWALSKYQELYNNKKEPQK